jgi:hypothetical protein
MGFVKPLTLKIDDNTKRVESICQGRLSASWQITCPEDEGPWLSVVTFS